MGHLKAEEKFYTSIVEELGERPEDVFLVDDSYLALRTGKKAGLEVIGIYDENSKDTWATIVSENKYSVNKLIELKNL